MQGLKTFKAYRLLYVQPALNLKKFCMLITLHLCILCGSEETVPFALYVFSRSVFITEVESVYCAVRFESLYNTYDSSLKG